MDTRYLCGLDLSDISIAISLRYHRCWRRFWFNIVRCRDFRWSVSVVFSFSKWILEHVESNFTFILLRIRGALSSAPLVVRSIGYMAAFAIGAYVDYSIVPLLYIGLPILFFVLFLCLPNTAPYLVRHGKYEVSKCLSFQYSNTKYNVNSFN